MPICEIAPIRTLLSLKFHFRVQSEIAIHAIRQQSLFRNSMVRAASIRRHGASGWRTQNHSGPSGERREDTKCGLAALLLFVICLLRRVLKYVFSSEFVRLPQTFSNMLFQCVERYVAVLAHLACTIRMMSLHMTKLPELYLTALM